MGLLANVKQTLNNIIRKPVQFLNYSNPYVYTDSRNSYKIDASDAINQVMSCIAQEIKKVEPIHIRNVKGDDIPQGTSSVQWILDNPNEYMTTAQFLEKSIRLLLLNHNLFIIPTWETYFDKYGNKKKKLTGLYPILPVHVDFLQDSHGNVGVRFGFANNYETMLDYNDVIHVKYNFCKHEFMGGTLAGTPDNESLIKLAEMTQELVDGIATGIKASYSVTGIVKYNTMLDKGTMQKNLNEMTETLRQGDSGILPLDLKSEYIPITRNINLVDEPTLKFLDEKILRYYGVSMSVLCGDFTAEQHGAFYQRACEHIIVELGQEFTKKLFTERERQFGNKVMFYPKELYFMTIEQKLELFNVLVDTSSCYQNELRTAFGLKPIPELAGKIATGSQKQYAETNAGISDTNTKNNENNDDTTEKTEYNKDKDKTDNGTKLINSMKVKENER